MISLQTAHSPEPFEFVAEGDAVNRSIKNNTEEIRRLRKSGGDDDSWFAITNLRLAFLLTQRLLFGLS